MYCKAFQNSVLPSLISEDQTGFMANRYIGDNIQLIYDLIRK